jgi:pyruvate,orthophosphate dikinase
MARRPAKDAPESSALRANLEETRREVVVPEEFSPLLDLVSQYYGVRKTTEKLLSELFHPLRNLNEIARNLKSICGSMFNYFERSPDRVRCVELFNRLFADLYGSDLPAEVLHSLVGTHLELIVTLTSSQLAHEYSGQTERALELLAELQEHNGLVFLPFSSLIKRVGSRLDHDPEIARRLACLYRGVISEGLACFTTRIDLMGWCGRQAEHQSLECAASVGRPLDQTMEQAREALATGADREVWGLANIDDLLSLTLSKARQIKSPIERIALYVYLAGIAELQYRNMEILRTLYYTIKTACDEGVEEDILRAIDLITDHLSRCDESHKGLLYKCLEKLGGGISTRDNHRIIRRFIERTIATGFEAPSISGVSVEWEVWVNPHHLPCLRTWLAIIENDPIQFQGLLSALVINLFFRGVFVSDTDLFQRDISALLNSDVADAFNLIMQLVAFFPVFFNEVGSEGELRDISTRIDQISHRKDPVIHYLRKQSHAESNNRLVGFAAAVFEYWRTGDKEALTGFIPDALADSLNPDRDWFRGVHRVAHRVDRELGVTERDLATLPIEDLRVFLDGIEEGRPADRERILLLVRLYRLLKAKYSNSSEQMRSLIEYSALVSREARQGFLNACDGGDHLEIVRAGNRALQELKATIVSTEVTEAFENIFLKRHIAAGIPSMYGTYKEPKFDSMGMMLRLINFLNPHLQECVASFNYRYMTRESIRHAHEIMEQMLIGLQVVGLRVHHLSTKLEILERGIALGTLSASQYLNIFDFMSEALSDVIEVNYITLHDTNLRRVVEQIVGERGSQGEAAREEVDRLSEEFLRSLISSTYAIQEFDLFLRRIRQTLRSMTETLSDRSCGVVLNYLPNRLISFFDDPMEPHEDQLCLGYKGYSLKRLKSLNLQVPNGFVISTELFNIHQAMSYEDLRADTRERVIAAVDRLERTTSRRFGDPERPLLLSVRSGSAFSMPGMMDTILNVGLSEALLDRLSQEPARAWSAWDCYRRYLQNVAMSCGVDRDIFDETMLRFKEKYKVERKVQFSAEQMREMAFEYKSIAVSGGARIFDDPVDQLMQAVYQVLRSWESRSAQLYRNQLQLSSDWGTGVIVQEMVFGNLNVESGSGVAFTRSPRSSWTGIGLFGDFTMCSQGEDVVAGLVHPYPISERQRTELAPDVDTCLETRFPEIFSALKKIADLLINEHRYEHQEIEFTFESARAEDLHLLQIRPLRFLRQQTIAVFKDPNAIQMHLLAKGIGVSGGAMTGVVAFTDADVRRFRSERPEHKIILLRPDTVPEDIGLVLAVDGLLTARGGFTSHAAVTAKRLGKCCIVNCKDMMVSETKSFARIGASTLRAGDEISIDGFIGSVYLGEHNVVVSHTNPAIS